MEISDIGYHVSWPIIEQLHTPLLEFAQQNFFLVPRTRLDLLRPSVSTRVDHKQLQQKQVHDDKAKCKTFQWVKEFTLGNTVGVQKTGRLDKS